MSLSLHVATYAESVDSLMQANPSFFAENPGMASALSKSSVDLAGMSSDVEEYNGGVYSNAGSRMTQHSLASSFSDISSGDVVKSFSAACSMVNMFRSGAFMQSALDTLANMLAGVVALTLEALQAMLDGVVGAIADWLTAKELLGGIDGLMGDISKLAAAFGAFLGVASGILGALSDCYPELATKNPELFRMKDAYDEAARVAPDDLTGSERDSWIMNKAKENAIQSSGYADRLGVHMGGLDAIKLKYTN